MQPTIHDAWTERGLSKDMLPNVITQISRLGHTGAIREWQDVQDRARAGWQEITRADWPGASEALDWHPPGWPPPQYEINMEERGNNLARMRQRIDKLSREAAPTESSANEVALLRARDLPDAQLHVRDATDASQRVLDSVRETEEKLKELEKERADFEYSIRQAKAVKDAQPFHYCPHCQGGLTLYTGVGRIEGWIPPDGEEIAKAQGLVSTEADKLREFDSRKAVLEAELERRRDAHGKALTVAWKARDAVIAVRNRLSELEGTGPSAAAKEEIKSLKDTITAVQKDTALYMRWDEAQLNAKNYIQAELVMEAIHAVQAEAVAS